MWYIIRGAHINYTCYLLWCGFFNWCEFMFFHPILINLQGPCFSLNMENSVGVGFLIEVTYVNIAKFVNHCIKLLLIMWPPLCRINNLIVTYTKNLRGFGKNHPCMRFHPPYHLKFGKFTCKFYIFTRNTWRIHL